MHSGLLPLLRKRSQSMPCMNKNAMPQPIHRIRRNMVKIQSDLSQQICKQLPLISLQGIKNKEEQIIIKKIQVIEKRNLQKLEQRYQTIDRWRQRYIPESSVMLIKQKIDQQSNFPVIGKDPNVDQKAFSRKLIEKSSKLFPITVKQSLTPAAVPDQREQSRRLQAELMNRLQRNKRYYEVKNNRIQKEINYFEQMNGLLSLQKVRQLQLKQKLIDQFLSKNNKSEGLFHKKIKLVPHQLHLLQRQTKKWSVQDNDFTFNPEENGEKAVDYSKIKKSISIKQFKLQLQKNIIAQTPEGWHVQQDIPIPQDEYQQ